MSWRLFIKSFGYILLMTSPKLRSYLEKYIQELYILALNTPNIYDDFFVETLAKILQIDLQKAGDN